jgi:hypothetical protein
MKLFMFYVGGRCKNSNIELHDMRFSIADSVEDCYPDLRAQWWGDPESLHLDCWGELKQVDGFDISISEEVSGQEFGNVYFVNLGGIRFGEFSELHRNVLIVARDEAEAFARAKEQVSDWKIPHRDNLFELEQIVDLSKDVRDKGPNILLSPAAERGPFHYQTGFLPIGRESPKFAVFDAQIFGLEHAENPIADPAQALKGP